MITGAASFSCSRQATTLATKVVVCNFPEGLCIFCISKGRHNYRQYTFLFS